MNRATGPRPDAGSVAERTLAGLRRDGRAVIAWTAAMVAASALTVPLTWGVLSVATAGPVLLTGIAAAAVGAALLTLSVMTAAMRSAFDAGAVRLRFGGTELRVLAVMLLVGVGLYLATVALIAVLVGVAVAAGAVLGGAAAVIVAVGAGIAACAVPFAALYCGVRLSLAVPLTVQRGRIALRAAWRLARGRFWFLTFGYFLMLLMSVVVLLPAFAWQAGDMTAVLRAGSDPAAVARAMAAIAEARAHPDLPALAVGIVLGGVGNGIAVALQGRMAAELLLAVQAGDGDGPGERDTRDGM